ncbi:patatin-like phospholipase family protein [Chryseobacterium sp. G0186]|uniref:patatin-like phospholipase family protein n=1 Tax=Chryseobacterium sp. G0186 TaxID=2487064 RepID=UPI000F4F4AD9|nr:patatin-like phospholipase family protein [Chryseobacterium sp. G0186]AZA77985.1 patatin-like phospholipase family protein [Chryseobacterium sp. G0186]
MDEKFKRAVIFSGGGTRLMIYLGIFAALDELNRKPDLLIASCGGSFAATVINAFPDHFSRKEYLKSEEYYQFVVQTTLTKHKKLSEIGFFSLKKCLDKRKAPFIEDVFNRYLVEMPQNLAECFPSLKDTQFSKEIPTVIIGSELLFTPQESQRIRNEKKLFQKVIFTDPETAQKISKESISSHSKSFKNSAVKETSKIITDFSILDSTRASISDMFYVKPLSIRDHHFMGGVIDLVPIELAKHLSKEVITEKKQPYTSIEEALIRSVFGFSANERLLETESIIPEFQIDTTSIKQDLKGHYLEKSINWKKLEISFSFPKTYQQFVADMEMQWQYGFDQTILHLKT